MLKNYLTPRLRDVIFIIIFFGVILLGPQMLNRDGDLPRHMAIGRYVLAGNFPPVNDIFSHTVPGAPFAPHKWLSGVLFYLAYLLFDERGMVLVSAVSLAAAFSLIYSYASMQMGQNLTIFMLVLWGAMLTSLHWIIRPHIFTMLCLAVWLVLVDRVAHGRLSRWGYLPLLMFIWNNIHGEYVAGLLVAVAYLAGWVWDYALDRPAASVETGKNLAYVLLSSIAVTILNPISLKAWGTVTNWLGNEYLMSHTEETLPPDFSNPSFRILLAFLVFSIFLLAIKRDKLHTGRAVTLGGFTAMVLLSARNIHLYGVIAPLLLAPALLVFRSIPVIERYESAFAKIENSARGFFWRMFAIVAGIILLTASPLAAKEHFSPAYFPADAVAWLKQNPQSGEMFNPFDWGGYLSLYLPKKKVFIDSQGDVYGEIFIRKYEQVIILGPGWQQVLDDYHVDWALIPVNWPLADALSSEGWQEVYRDGTSIILIRSTE